MATSNQLRTWWSKYRCDTGEMVRVGFPGDGKTWNLLVAAEAAPAWRHFADIMARHGYLFRETAGGTYNCRKIAGTNSWSLHSYGTALDLNPSKNPYGNPKRYDYPAAFIAEVLTVKALDDNPLFRWGGAWSTPDTMHWEINTKPSLVPAYDEGDRMAFLPIQYGHGYKTPPADSGLVGDQTFKTQDVVYVQNLLNRAGWSGTIDGVYGSETIAGVIKYGASKDGKVVSGWVLDNVQAQAWRPLITNLHNALGGQDHDHDGRYLKSVEGKT